MIPRFFFEIVEEQEAHRQEVLALERSVFGPGRFARTAYRLREQAPFLCRLGQVALAGGRVVGSVRLTQIALEELPGMLLGPLVVHPMVVGNGVGRGLMQTALALSWKEEALFVLLIGDHGYYEKFGFSVAPEGVAELPGPADPARRLLYLRLRDISLPKGVVCGRRVLHAGPQA